MTGLDGQRGTRRGRVTGNFQLPESHLLPDAVVAFVDGELSVAAHERAAMHLMNCRGCAAEVGAQRQIRATVHGSFVPSLPAGLLASLHSIPNSTTLSVTPDNLAVSADGEIVVVQRPESPAKRRTAPLAASRPLGTGMTGSRVGKRAAQGAGVMMSGLVLGALALVATADDGRGTSGRTGEQGTAVAPAHFTPSAGNSVMSFTGTRGR